KGSQGKKSTNVPEADVDVLEESNSEPVRKRTASRSLTEVAEKASARLVHATHERIMIEYDPEPTRRRPSGIAFRDTSSVSKKITPNPSLKLNEDSQALEAQVKEVVGYRGSATSSERTGTKPGVLDKSADEDVDWIYFNDDDEKKDDVDDDKSIDLEMTDDEEIIDEFVRGAEHVNEDKDEEMTEAEVAEPEKDTSLVGTINDTTYAEINSLLEVNIQQEIPHILSLSILNVPVFVISEPSVLTPILETPSVAPATTLLPSLSVSIIPHVLQQQVTPIPTPPITTESPTIITTVLKSDALTVV
nr:hypothetical protein [Tanacetum cinerariifolium]